MLMDEPFGALDPITRDRLQTEFLRLQALVRKTVIFVTHDIDEAIRIGDRVAILRQGGVLAQYDTPDAVLAHPADEFVARFVGADRALKRLSLRRLRDVELDPPTPDGHALELASRTTLRDALSAMLSAGADRCQVRGDAGEPAGSLSLTSIARLLAEERR
jgi:osmoprotectant transport system ATP-binding protein